MRLQGAQHLGGGSGSDARVHQDLDAGTDPHVVTNVHGADFRPLQPDYDICRHSMIVVDDLNESTHEDVVSNADLVLCRYHAVATDNRI